LTQLGGRGLWEGLTPPDLDLSPLKISLIDLDISLL